MRMAVITKSFAPDFELCADLHRSVLDCSPDSVHHHIIVPRQDLKLFGRLAGSRTHIRCETDFLPRSFVPVPFGNFTINLGRPFPPVRGWILQQVVKLAAVAASEDDVVLVVDSDVEFVRPFSCGDVHPGWRGALLRKAPCDHRTAATPHDLAAGRSRIAGAPAGRSAIHRLHLLDAGLRPDDRPANARARGGHHRPPVDHRDRRTAPFLRVDPLRRVRRRSDRRTRPIHSPRTTHCAWRTGRRPRWIGTARSTSSAASGPPMSLR